MTTAASRAQTPNLKGEIRGEIGFGVDSIPALMSTARPDGYIDYFREEIIKASMFEEIIGNSPSLQQVLSRVAKVAPTDSTVLITGETGTGKELIARAIHKTSKRSGRAFVSVNCSAIPQSLIVSELFGHEKGAFTGATGRRFGRFELAERGTIFLDEIGDLPKETQVALLRVLQEHEFERVGGTRSIGANVRVIVATNRDLEAAMADGTFREDLFYRLNVFPIEIPSLRERREDISMPEVSREGHVTNPERSERPSRPENQRSIGCRRLTRIKKADPIRKRRSAHSFGFARANASGSRGC